MWSCEDSICKVDGFEDPTCRIDGFKDHICKINGFQDPIFKIDGFEDSSCKNDGFEDPIFTTRIFIYLTNRILTTSQRSSLQVVTWLVLKLWGFYL